MEKFFGPKYKTLVLYYSFKDSTKHYQCCEIHCDEYFYLGINYYKEKPKFFLFLITWFRLENNFSLVILPISFSIK